MLLYIIPSWLVVTAIAYTLTVSPKHKKFRKYNCRKLLKKYKTIDETYNKSLF